jgi:hypothetical protein
MTDGFDWIERAGARAKGKRPAYFDTPESDRTLSIVLALMAEVSALRERLDTVERLLDARFAVAGHERGVQVKAYIARVMRGLTQEMEAMATPEPSVEQVSRELRDL